MKMLLSLLFFNLAGGLFFVVQYFNYSTGNPCASFDKKSDCFFPNSELFEQKIEELENKVKKFDQAVFDKGKTSQNFLFSFQGGYGELVEILNFTRSLNGILKIDTLTVKNLEMFSETPRLSIKTSVSIRRKK